MSNWKNNAPPKLAANACLVNGRRLKVYVNAQANDLEYRLFEMCGIDRADNMDEADIVQFIGGADVNPMLYGEQPLSVTSYNVHTDDRDLIGWRAAKDKIKVGICRGGQFLNVMNGGKLWQDVNNHCGSHWAVDRFTGQRVMVTSTHHQQFRPAQTAITILTARETTFKKSAEHVWNLKDNGTAADDFFKIDHEVVWYPDTRSLCFQPHPEYPEAYDKCTPYFRDVLWKCIRNQYPLDARGSGILREIRAEKGK